MASSSSSASLASLVQMRWQSVRLAESITFVEQENLELRMQVESLKKSLSDAESKVASSKGKTGKRLSKAEELAMRQELKMTYTRLDDIKHVADEFKSEIMFHSYGIASQLTTAKQAIETMIRLMRGSMEDNEELKEQVDFLTQRNREQECHIKEIKNESVEPLKSELERLQRDLSELRGEMVLVKDDADRIQRENTVLQQKHEEEQKTSASDLEMSQKRCDDLIDQMNHLKGENNYLREAVSLHNEEVKRLNISHEEQINAVGMENLSLKLKVADQDEQIRKMKLLLGDNKTHFGKFMDLKNENANLKDMVKSIESNVKIPRGQLTKLKVDIRNNEVTTAVPPSIKWPSSITPRSARRFNVDPSNSPPPSPRSGATRKTAPAPPMLAKFEQKIITHRGDREVIPSWLKEPAFSVEEVSVGNYENYGNIDENRIRMDRQQLPEFNMGKELTLADKLSPRPPSVDNAMIGPMQQGFDHGVFINGNTNKSEVSVDSYANINMKNAFTEKLFHDKSISSAPPLSKIGNRKIVLSTSLATSTDLDEHVPKEITEAIDNYSDAVRTAKTLQIGSPRVDRNRSSILVGVPGLLSSKQTRSTSLQMPKSTATTSTPFPRKVEV